jgi:hypothetical protein
MLGCVVVVVAAVKEANHDGGSGEDHNRSACTDVNSVIVLFCAGAKVTN